MKSMISIRNGDCHPVYKAFVLVYQGKQRFQYMKIMILIRIGGGHPFGGHLIYDEINQIN